MPTKPLAILNELQLLYPDAHCELDYKSPFELLIATILSAQCTDERVNKITPLLFAKYQHPQDYVYLPQAQLEEDIRSCGLYRNKAKNIIACCTELVERFGGEVPASLSELESLPGVGRKTACVVAYNAFGIPAFAVDTHVFRVARRLGLTTGENPVAVERDLCAMYPEEVWGQMHHWLIWHGRRVCYARNPVCDSCSLNEMCSSVSLREGRPLS